MCIHKVILKSSLHAKDSKVGERISKSKDALPHTSQWLQVLVC